jgi:hypothetical protein
METDALIISLGMLAAFGVGFLLFWIYMYWQTSKNAKIIYQDSETTCKIFNKQVDNDNVVVGNKTFSTKGVTPKSVKTRWGWQPLFRFKYNIPHALPFGEGEEIDIQPEALTRLGELATLDKILKPKKVGWQEMIVYILLGAAVGVIVGFALVATGAIPIGETAAATVIPAAPSVVR